MRESQSLFKKCFWLNEISEYKPLAPHLYPPQLRRHSHYASHERSDSASSRQSIQTLTVTPIPTLCKRLKFSFERQNSEPLDGAMRAV